MAETVKILSPEKKVFLANELAECPTHVRISKEDVLKAKERYPKTVYVIT